MLTTLKTKLASLYTRFKSYSRRKKLAVIGGPLLLFLLVTPILTYIYFARDIANAERLMNRNNTGIVLLDRHGKTIYSSGKVRGEEVKLTEISDDLEQALIASEDEDFYNHAGYSVRGIAAAMYANVVNQDLRRYGGSTITQQLVKNNLLTSDKSFLRKYQELSIAIAVDRHYTKDQILEMYLNSVYFGEGAFGVDAAAEQYFGKDAAELSLAESSMLVAILPAPSAYSPISGDIVKAQEHQKRVLSRMVEAGYISSEEKDAALQTEVTYSPAEAPEQEYAEHFAQMVISDLQEKYGEEKVARGGYKVSTSLDLEWQKIAEEQVRSRVAQLTAQGGDNASLVAIDPKSGEVRALVGSADWDNPDFGKVNMAISPRQPGSSFKPIYYTEALDKRVITAATILEDKSKTYGETYRPENYDFRYRGDISVRRALALSLNIPAVDVMQKLGVEEASQAAQRMGISTVDEPEKYGLSLALGTAETKLLDMTNAYAAFANSGNQHTPVTITGIKDKYDKTIFTDNTRAKRVVSEQAAFITSSILSDQQARAATFGSSLTISGRSSAAKTGTTNDNKDAWTIGYTPSLAIGVWVGNNQNKPMSGVAGSSGAAPIWRNAMQKMLSGSPKEEFKQPKNIEKINVCSSNGLRSNRGGEGTYSEFFIRGSAPTKSCNEPAAPKEDDDKAKKEAEDVQKKEEERLKEEERKRQEEAENQEEIDEEEPDEPDETEEPTEEPVEEEPEGGMGGEDPGTTDPAEPTDPAATT